ncbi:MAG: cell wall hydrolase [Eubacteriales bacterium]
MKRKLFTLMLVTLSILSLMGASYARDRAETIVSVTAGSSLLEAQPASNYVAQNAVSALDFAVDYSIIIDGQAAALKTHRTEIEGVTYVALVNMVKMLNISANIAWDAETNATTITTDDLTFTAQEGMMYVVANERYLYLSQGVVVQNGTMLLPLETIVEALGGTMVEVEGLDAYQIARGTSAILAGDEFYNEEDLFWLSRVVYAESGHEPLSGQMGVAMVVMKRVEDPRYPDTIHDVLAQNNQFSTYKNGALADRTPNESSTIAAKLVLDGGIVESLVAATHFDSIPSGSWADRNLDTIEVIGGHRFYG